MSQSRKLHSGSNGHEQRAVKWWLDPPPAKRPRGRPRKVWTAAAPATEMPELDQVTLLDEIPDFSGLGMPWTEPRTDLYEARCIICNFGDVWVAARTLKKQPVIRCGKGHVMSIVVPAGIDPPRLKLAKVA